MYNFIPGNILSLNSPSVEHFRPRMFGGRICPLRGHFRLQMFCILVNPRPGYTKCTSTCIGSYILLRRVIGEPTTYHIPCFLLRLVDHHY